MALELRQNLQLTQQLVMTPQLQQAIKLLQLQRVELIDVIEQEIVTNPLLEEDLGGSYREDSPDEAAGNILKEDLTSFKQDNEKKVYQVEWESTGHQSGSMHSGSSHEFKDGIPYENILTKKASLMDHLTWQLRLSNFNNEERLIGISIVGNLDKDGYLKIPLDEISKERQASNEVVEGVLEKIQTFDPVGVAARDVRECLIVQAKFYNIENSIIEEILKDHFSSLISHDYSAIAKKLGISLKEVEGSVKLIEQMEPKPGRIFNEEEIQYIRPDVFVYKFEDEYVVTLNEEGMPKLKINSIYLGSLHQNNIGSTAKDYIREKLRSALWMIRSIQQRQRTIYRTTKCIMNFQKEFLDKGIAFLKPLILKDIAESLEMHESTISRVTTNKYAHTPQGIFELKYFFNSGFSRVGKEAIASESVKEEIKQIIQNEDSKRPYGDRDISEILKKKGINIARRTVAKYREMLRILPSSGRKNRR